jgi:hypothetical protein
VPERLIKSTQKPRQTEAVDLAARCTAAKWSVREWGAMAASVTLGLFVGVGVMQQLQPPIATGNGGLMARGVLSRALNTQLASEEAGPVRIGLSFRTREGGYCRTFDLTKGGASGLACRENNAWSIPLMTTHTNGGEGRTAGAPLEILFAADERIDGEPLDAEAERAARDGGWRR